MPDKTRVMEAIRKAFAGVAREEGVTLHEAQVIDDYGSNEQRRAARERDTDRSWHEVLDADLRRCESSLFFFDDKGFRYYAAPFMLWTLQDVSAGHSTLFKLSRLHEEPRIALFNDEQREALALFLLHYANEDPAAAESILKFWWQYLPREFAI